jgi:hypothetical protein
MILYLLLLVLTGLLTLIALGFTIGGLVKKKEKVWITSLVLFVLFTMLTVLTGYTYVKETVNYMASDEFQDETRKKSETMGKTWGNTVSGTAKGLEETLDETAIEKLAAKSATIAGKGVSAIAKGLDETTGKTTVFADESIEQAGVTIGRAEHIAGSPGHKFGLFLEFKENFDDKLILTAYDSKGLKQDITELEVKQLAGKGKVYVFQFDNFQPGLSGYCILSKD